MTRPGISGHEEPGDLARRYLLGQRWLLVARQALVEAARDRVTSSAASLAFHWFLAIFPATIALVGVAHLAGLSGTQLGTLVHDVNFVLPAQAATVIDQALKARSSSRADAIGVAVGAVVALWGGVEAMASLQVGLDVAFEVTRDRGFLERRLAALPMLALTVLLGGSGFTLVVLGAPVGKLIAGSVPVAGAEFAVLWGWLRWVVALLLVMLLLSSYYTLGPAWQHRQWRWASAGSVLATLSWLGASIVFSFYLDHFSHESQTYGPFAGVAVLLLWLLVAAVIVLLGAELDCEVTRAACSQCSTKAAKRPQAHRRM
jgi:membrane protein